MQIMRYSLKHHLSRLQRTLLLLIPLLCLASAGSTHAAEESPASPLCPVTSITLAKTLQTTIFNRVAVVPFQADDPQLAADISHAFYTALEKTRKYELIPAADVSNRLAADSGQPAATDLQQAITLGRALKARGVIYGSLLPDRLYPLQNRGTIASLAFNVHMIDAQTGRTCWTINVVCRGEKQHAPLNREQLDRIMQENLQQLIAAQVDTGDIFSTRLVQPTVISTRGELRKVRVILQPDPPHVYTAYQLLSAERPDDVFIARTAPVNNDHAPIILEDPDLKDGKSYYYTVIGLTDDGLANVPAPPFSVTTSGAPTPLDSLQASGNNLRHIHLLWAPSQDPNVIGYTIYRSNTPDGPFTKIAEINDREQQNFTDYGTAESETYGSLADDSRYYYTIRTRNRFGIESSDAPVASAQTKGAPLPPTQVQAIENQAKKIPLLWTAGEDPDIRGYTIFRSEREQGPFQLIDVVHDRETQEYTDTGSRNTPLADNTTYFYRIRSVNMVDVSSKDSDTVSATTKAVPAAVHGVRVSSNLFRKVTLHWPPEAETDIKEYEIFRGETPDELRMIAKVSAPATSYTDSDLRDGSTYWYQLRAIDQNRLKGAFFSPISASTKPPPTAPTGLSAELVQSQPAIMLRWKANPEKDIHHYEVYSVGFMTTKIGDVRETFFMYTDELDPGDEYRFQVRAVDNDGLMGSFSRPVMIRIPMTKNSAKE